MLSADQELILQSIERRDLKALAGVRAPTHVDDFYPLHCAADLGDAGVMEVLLAGPWVAEIDRFDETSLTPLMRAAIRGNLAMIEILLRTGANVNACDIARCGNTAIREVIPSADPELIAFLLSKGADPTIPGWMQLTALDKARERMEERRDEASRRILAILEGTS